MTLEEFEATLHDPDPPGNVPASLQALWLERNGRWDAAHDALQGLPDAGGGAWVHAYLHRVEGDASNARYWYKRAGREPVSVPLEEEWRQIARALLDAEM